MKQNLPLKLLLIFVAFNLMVGLFIASDFWRTVDEEWETITAEAALRFYTKGSFGKYSDYGIRYWDRYYGTAMTMLALAAENNFQPVLGTAHGVVTHYTYFIIFQIGILSIFFLTKKFTSDWIGLVIAILFATQPLYFGHAFNNPKDIPLLSIFLAVVTAGFYMSDKVISAYQANNYLVFDLQKIPFKSIWQSTPLNVRKKLLSAQWIWLFYALAFGIFYVNIPNIVSALYYADANSTLGKLFGYIASQRSIVEITTYINNAYADSHRLFFILVGLLGFADLLLFLKEIKQLRNSLLSDWLIPIVNAFKSKKILILLSIFGAGILWGVGIATRVVAVFAGGIVGLYLIMKARSKAILPLLTYSVFGGVAAYMFWPQLWHRGFSVIIGGLTQFSDYFWDKNVFFQGEVFRASELPRTYLPISLSIQFTEPVMILAFFGLAIGVWRIIKKKDINWQMFLVLILWILLPVVYVVIRQPNLYNNCRQFLFITPPLFVLSGISLEAVLGKLRNKTVHLLLCVALLVPGITALIQLHPYQYIYFNEFVGGVDGTFRYYQQDYWEVSSGEAMHHISQIAPENAKVIFWKNRKIMDYYAREDLEIMPRGEIENEQSMYDYDYLIIPTGFNSDLNNFVDAPTIYKVERNGATLVLVKELSGNQ